MDIKLKETIGIDLKVIQERSDKLSKRRLSIHRSIVYLFLVLYPFGVYFYVSQGTEDFTIFYYIQRLWMVPWLFISLILSYKVQYIKDRFPNFVAIGIMGVLWFQSSRAGTPGITPMAPAVFGVCLLVCSMLYMTKKFVYLYFTFALAACFNFSYGQFIDAGILIHLKNTSLFATILVYPFIFHMLRIKEEEVYHDEIYLRLEAEKYLKEVLENYEGLTELMPIQMSTLNTMFKYTFINKASSSNIQLNKKLIGKDDYFVATSVNYPQEIPINRTRKLVETLATRKPTKLFENIEGKDFIRHYVPKLDDKKHKVEKIFTFSWEIRARS